MGLVKICCFIESVYHCIVGCKFYVTWDFMQQDVGEEEDQRMGEGGDESCLYYYVSEKKVSDMAMRKENLTKYFLFGG